MYLSINEELGVDLVVLIAGGPGLLYELVVGKSLDQFTILCPGKLLGMICCWYSFVLNTDLLSPFENLRTSNFSVWLTSS